MLPCIGFLAFVDDMLNLLGMAQRVIKDIFAHGRRPNPETCEGGKDQQQIAG